MNAYENVEYMLRLAGIRKNRKGLVIEALRMVGLGARISSYASGIIRW